MKTIKLLTIIVSLFLIFQLSTFGITDKEKIKQLEEVNKQLSDNNAKLTKDNVTLNKALVDTTKALEESTKALEDSTVLIAQQKERISQDQEEVIKLRTQLDEFVKLSLTGLKNFFVGAGISYPLGGEVYGGMFIPNFPLGFFANFSVSQSDNSANPIDIKVVGGVIFRF
jgi:hypothetical protein